jgi:DNA-binding NarL/FixJ family response regulator
MKSMVESLESVMSARDPYTVAHQQRVTQLALAIAKEMGLEEECALHLEMAARLHDLGKISVPIDILSKPGKLSVQEMEMIKTHPIMGTNMLKPLTIPLHTILTILQHHERLNGSGYPFGLDGDDILLEARILGVADVIEAMSSHRPYRAALKIEIVLDEISRNKGKLYDPLVVEAYERLSSQESQNKRPDMSTRVLVADDHQIVREGLRSLLEKEPWINVVGEAEDGRRAVELARKLTPDVIIMDMSMPDLNGIEATRQIVAEFPKVKIIALSMHDDRRFVLNMLRVGAKGYMLKDSTFKDLAKAIRVVVANQTYLSSEIADIVVNDLVSSGPSGESTAFRLLSPREREVLQLIAEGKGSSQIGESLHISVKTVETHRAQLMAKVKVKSIAELTKFAIREGLTMV